jgi:hypothetical protein
MRALEFRSVEWNGLAVVFVLDADAPLLYILSARQDPLESETGFLLVN